jgi:hypothetical protein
MTAHASLRWRPLASSDLPALLAVAAVVHPAYPEDEAVFASRLRLFPAGCRALVDAQDKLQGYVVSHPWHEASPVPLGLVLAELPAPARTLYLHDISLLPRARGSGAAGTAVRELVALAEAQGLPSVSLVSVSGSAGFWTRHGFRALSPEAGAALQGYGDAAFMVRELAQPLRGRA